MGRLATIIHSNYFDFFVTMAVLANSIFFAYQIQSVSDGPEFWIVHLGFCIFFVSELILRIACEPYVFFSRHRVLNFIDVVAVLLSVVEVLIKIGENGSANMVLWRLIRLVRLIRISRILRLKLFRELRLMVHSMVHCLKPFLWTVCLLHLEVYFFALVFTDGAIHALQNKVDDNLQLYFGSLMRSVYYLLAAVLGGVDWTSCGDSLGSVHPAYRVLFVVYVVFTQLALLNVVTGIFVDCATRAAMSDRQLVLQEEMMKEGLHKRELEHIFMEVDDDSDGWVKASKLEEFLTDDKFGPT